MSDGFRYILPFLLKIILLFLARFHPFSDFLRCRKGVFYKHLNYTAKRTGRTPRKCGVPVPCFSFCVLRAQAWKRNAPLCTCCDSHEFPSFRRHPYWGLLLPRHSTPEHHSALPCRDSCHFSTKSIWMSPLLQLAASVLSPPVLFSGKLLSPFLISQEMEKSSQPPITEPIIFPFFAVTVKLSPTESFSNSTLPPFDSRETDANSDKGDT